MKDIGSHSETEFSFEDFQSALIIGKVRGNERFSNASGKSTIFNAISYVLYNEIQFSTLDKIIRNGCDLCSVEMDFRSSLDNSIYRAKRSTSHKSGTDLRLFRKDGGDWTDLTQRRSSDTEKELLKVIGFNYRVFCASSLFVQPGAENNTQKDFGNLPALTVEKRKAVLREILQLNGYSNYEKLAKSKAAQISGEIEKNTILLSSLGDPSKEIALLENKVVDAREILQALEMKRESLKKTLEEHHLESAFISAEMANVKSQKENLSGRIRELDKETAKYSNTLTRLNIEVKSLPLEGKKIAAQIEADTQKIAELKAGLLDQSNFLEQRKKADQNISNTNAQLQVVKANLDDLQKPLPSGANCSLCHQKVTEEHRHYWEQELIKLSSMMKTARGVLSVRLKEYQSEAKNLTESISANQKKIDQISSLERQLSLYEKDLSFKRMEYKKIIENYEESKSLLKEKTAEKIAAQEELSKLNLSFLEKREARLNELNRNILALKKNKDAMSQDIAQLTGNQAVFNHKIESCKDNLKKITDFHNKSASFQHSLSIHQKVVEAFSSGGIPSLIIQSVLDDFQDEANKWLVRLHPGIQLQFIITKDNSKKQQEDTLDILYFIGGAEMEYRQLSGAQKMLVSLAIKLAIIHIMNRKLGVSVKLMLLDEVDQPLDPGTAEIFAEAIKVLHKDIKILAITHNPELKHKFSHAVVVDQDENNISTGSLNIW